MALFGFGKKKEEKENSCCCNAENKQEATSCGGHYNEQAAKAADGLSIKVLGSGCKSCHALYENAQAAVAVMGLKTEVEYVTDMQKIVVYGAMRMPALVVNEKVVSMGRVLKVEELEKLFHKLGY